MQTSQGETIFSFFLTALKFLDTLPDNILMRKEEIKSTAPSGVKKWVTKKVECKGKLAGNPDFQWETNLPQCHEGL